MNLPTAEELASSIYQPIHMSCNEFAINLAIEFAKLHVKAALENAYDCGAFKGWSNSIDDNAHKELFVKNIMSRQSIK